MTKRTGRPPLDATDPTVEMCLSLPSKRYDELYRQARAERVSVPELVRRTLTPNRLFLGKVPARDPSR
jgi:hypothetical protein